MSTLTVPHSPVRSPIKMHNLILFRQRHAILQQFPLIKLEIVSDLNVHGTRQALGHDPETPDLWRNYVTTGGLERFLARRGIFHMRT